MSTVAIVLPVYNAETTVAAAIHSVRTQTYDEWALIVLDDGSTDASRSTVREAFAGDARCRLIERPHTGLIETLNAGLDAVPSGCAYVARMDADDRMHPDRLRCQVQALEKNPTLTLVSSRVVLEPRSPGLVSYIQWLNSLVTPDDIDRNVYVESPVCHPSIMARLEAVHAVDGYRERGWPEDYDLWLRLHERGAQMAQAPGAVHVWSDSPQRLTRTDPRYEHAQFTRLKAHFLARRWPERLRIWGAGRDGRRLARALEAEGVAIQSFIDIDPKKIGGVRRGNVPVLGPNDLNPPREADAPIITAVGVPGARDWIRSELVARGYVECRDFVCAA